MADFPNFFGKSPNYQHALDLFEGEWSTRLPDETGLIAGTGETRLCEDARIHWAAEKLGGFAGKKVLELGPLEGGHSYMLEKLGAASVTAVEASARAYLKCLVLKEALGLQRVRFLPGDIAPFLRESTETFDIGIACGVLYHLTNPVEVIEGLSRRCRAVFIWTQYFEPGFFEKHGHDQSPFSPPVSLSHSGFKHTLHPRNYAAAHHWKGFCGGGAHAGSWLPRADLLGALAHFKFRIIEAIEDPNKHGPAIMVAAVNESKSKS